MTKRRALVLGGSGYVGAAIVKALSARELDVVFTYRASEKKARDLAENTGSRALFANLLEVDSVHRACDEASADGLVTILIHACARFDARGVGEIDAAGFDEMMHLGVRAPLLAAQRLAATWTTRERADILFLGGLDRGQSYALPPCFAAAEGAKSALVMALAKELGPKNVRVNMLALGLLEGGSSARIDESLAKDFASFSALGRRGTAEEVAEVAAFVVLDSDFLSARTIAVNGGL